MISKSHILEEIRRTAAENEGQPLGVTRFEKETGIKEADWSGKHWVRWGDALVEAGFEPNKMQGAYDDEWLMEMLAAYISEIGHYPVRRELQMKARQDAGFPSANVFERRGKKTELAARIVQLFGNRDDLSRAVDICRELSSSSNDTNEVDEEPTDDSDVEFGWVYLKKSGKFYKIGRTNSLDRRQRELAIQMPEELVTIHTIKTDDPPGIEAYWHKRFADRRKGGEWFDLTSSDVRAFKRRKFM